MVVRARMLLIKVLKKCLFFEINYQKNAEPSASSNYCFTIDWWDSAFCVKWIISMNVSNTRAELGKRALLPFEFCSTNMEVYWYTWIEWALSITTMIHVYRNGWLICSGTVRELIVHSLFNNPSQAFCFWFLLICQHSTTWESKRKCWAYWGWIQWAFCMNGGDFW